jgi:hypothetical protein
MEKTFYETLIFFGLVLFRFSMNNDTSMEEIECPDFDESGQSVLNNLSFFLEGIVQTPIAISGILVKPKMFCLKAFIW